MSAERPQTSKPRGICKYYQTDRGCYNGDNCRFLHGEHEQLTPFDKSKTCKFFAAGYCRRGSQCWFRHVEPGSSQTAVQPSPSVETVDEDTELCSICYEKPVTYGLLGGCSHLFCLRCIREWRDPSGKPSDMVSSGSTKKCPMCRAHSRFITPSSIFYTQGDPRKIEAIEKYKASMARVPCKHFQQSPPERRYCPFGQDCFYQHLNADGTPFIFKHGFDRVSLLLHFMICAC
ncbi:hypothetical protein OBBRIDRAFT_724329 [Obba rivulosa]|uniref:RING-type E3 ubiquitin transferase n=1 Tax=Obba rivulosa TaxID=1052685 RepID=A0A8E2DQ04_9APHY|nr:hypothetical protein OBBRIDRAFT_724329 [Obba rivulosa]